MTESFEHKLHKWGYVHYEPELSLSKLIGTHENARLAMEVLCGQITLWSLDEFNLVYAERIYELILKWDTWTFAEGRLCCDLLRELKDWVQQLVERHPGEARLVFCKLLLEILQLSVVCRTQNVQNQNV